MYIGACNELRVDTKRTEIVGKKVYQNFYSDSIHLNHFTFVALFVLETHMFLEVLLYPRYPVFAGVQ